MLGFSTVAVSGNSMSPSYREGDWLIIRKLSGKKHTLKLRWHPWTISDFRHYGSCWFAAQATGETPR